MFSGFGGASWALKKVGIDFEVVGISEIDKYAIQCFNQNFPDIKNFGDCTKINPNDLPDFDLLVGGFPCSSFSVAGKGLGELDPRGTLFYEIIRIAEVKKPKYMLLENVKGLTNKPHKKTFEKIISELRRIGYDVRYKVLNSKEYGIPQNRQRVFFVCKLGQWRLDEFQFPEKEELKIFLKDILEEEVDSKYYLSDEQTKILVGTMKDKNKNYFTSGKIYSNDDCGNANRIFKPEGVSQSIQSSTRTKIIGNVNPSGRGMNGNVYFGEVSPTLTTNKGEGAKIIQVGMINQTCKKRTFETPKEINEYLKKNKEHRTIQEIADYLNIPKTQAEHYFRTDNSRAIPSPEIWIKLKKLLKLNKFDKEVLDIYEKEIEFESTRRVYLDEGVSPTISSTNADKIVQLNNPTHSNNRVYSDKGCSPSLNTMQGGNRSPFVLSQPLKFLNRNQKNLQGKYRGCVDASNTNGLNLNGRIRKLSPTECFRLQGFTEDQINLSNLSNTQRYKLAGNGFEINLVSKIFKQMFK